MNLKNVSRSRVGCWTFGGWRSSNWTQSWFCVVGEKSGQAGCFQHYSTRSFNWNRDI